MRASHRARDPPARREDPRMRAVPEDVPQLGSIAEEKYALLHKYSPRHLDPPYAGVTGLSTSLERKSKDLARALERIGHVAGRRLPGPEDDLPRLRRTHGVAPVLAGHATQPLSPVQPLPYECEPSSRYEHHHNPTELNPRREYRFRCSFCSSRKVELVPRCRCCGSVREEHTKRDRVKGFARKLLQRHPSMGPMELLDRCLRFGADDPHAEDRVATADSEALWQRQAHYPPSPIKVQQDKGERWEVALGDEPHSPPNPTTSQVAKHEDARRRRGRRCRAPRSAAQVLRYFDKLKSRPTAEDTVQLLADMTGSVALELSEEAHGQAMLDVLNIAPPGTRLHVLSRMTERLPPAQWADLRRLFGCTCVPDAAASELDEAASSDDDDDGDSDGSSGYSDSDYDSDYSSGAEDVAPVAPAPPRRKMDEWDDPSSWTGEKTEATPADAAGVGIPKPPAAEDAAPQPLVSLSDMSTRETEQFEDALLTATVKEATMSIRTIATVSPTSRQSLLALLQEVAPADALQVALALTRLTRDELRDVDGQLYEMVSRLPATEVRDYIVGLVAMPEPSSRQLAITGMSARCGAVSKGAVDMQGAEDEFDAMLLEREASLRDLNDQIGAKTRAAPAANAAASAAANAAADTDDSTGAPTTGRRSRHPTTARNSSTAGGSSRRGGRRGKRRDKKGRDKEKRRKKKNLNFVVPMCWTSFLRKGEKRGAAAAADKRLFPLQQVRELILQVYETKITVDALDLEKEIYQPQDKLSQFVINHMLRMYGSRDMLAERLGSFVASLRAYTADPFVFTFLRFCDVLEPLPTHALQFYLSSLMHLQEAAVNMDFFKGSIPPDKLRPLSLAKAGVAVRNVGQHMGVNVPKLLANLGHFRYVYRVHPSQPGGMHTVDVTEAMALLMNTWADAEQAFVRRAGEVFEQYDDDDSLTLDADEFRLMVRGIQETSPALRLEDFDDSTIARMYIDAVTRSPTGELDPASFALVAGENALLRRVLGFAVFTSEDVKSCRAAVVVQKIVLGFVIRMRFRYQLRNRKLMGAAAQLSAS